MKNKFTWMGLTFLIGLIIGAVIVWLCYCGCGKRQCDHQCKVVETDSLQSGMNKIDTTAANNYFKTYLLSPMSVDTLKAFTVTLEQYNAMTLILNNHSTAQGFRIYMGADSIPSNRVMMVVGFGSPEYSGDIYSTSAAGSGPCPIVCDQSSPIIKK
jgi:hypothetical protein